jgi:hypothetical protein
MNLENFLYDKILSVLQGWNDDKIYALSFLVTANRSNEYCGYKNVCAVWVSYNSESDCNNAGLLSESRWNYAFWRQNTFPIIDPLDASCVGTKILFEWYANQGIENVGFEDYDNAYDENMNYVGKGPVGFYELLCVVSKIAKKMQTAGVIRERFGNVPIIVHDYDQCNWYTEEATMNANPSGEADTFLKAIRIGYSD